MNPAWNWKQSLAKKTGRSKTKSKNKRHLKAVPSAPKMPLQLVLNHRVVDSMAAEFIQWNTAEFPDPAEASECLELVKLFLSAQHAIDDSSSATAIAAESVDAAVESIASALAPKHVDEAFDDLYFALDPYVRFLKDTGRWTGTEDAYSELQDVLGSGTPGTAQAHPGITIPHLTDEEQEAAFNNMPLIRRAAALLEWLDTGKEVTATGALRLKDIEPAAAAVGVPARGKRGAKRPAMLFGQETSGGQPDGPLEVGTMYGVPVLTDVWPAMVEAGLMTLTATRAVPGPQATGWTSTKMEKRLKARLMLSVAFLVRVIYASNDGWDGKAVQGLLLAILTYGTTDDPVPIAEIEALASLDAGKIFQDDRTANNPDDLADDRGDAGLGTAYASYAAMKAQQSLSLLAELGLVEAETHYQVPPVAIQCVDLAAGFLGSGDEGSDEESVSNVVPLHAPARTDRPSQDR